LNPSFLPAPDPTEVEAAASAVLRTKAPPTESMRGLVMQLLLHKQLDAIMNGNYDLAGELQSAASVVSQNHGETVIERQRNLRQIAIQEHSDAVAAELDAVRESFAARHARLESETQDQLTGLQEKHQRELRDFKVKWQNPGFLAKYQRPSPDLIAMRLQERKLALVKCYEEAKAKRKVADKRQREEERKIAETVERLMERDYFKLREGQEAEVQKARMRYDNRRAVLFLEEERAIEPIEYALKQMEAKKDVAPTKRLLLFARGGPCQPDLAPPVLAKRSPRTAAKLAEFRHRKKTDLKV
jgi:hypothetical protein